MHNRTDTLGGPNYYSDSSVATGLIRECVSWLDLREWGSGAHHEKGMGADMLWTIFVILVVLWLLGIVTSYTMGGFIHLLLVLAVVVLVIRLLQGRSVVS